MATSSNSPTTKPNLSHLVISAVLFGGIGYYIGKHRK